MSIYRNIHEYAAAHFEEKFLSKEEARLAIVKHLQDITNMVPLHQRGEKRPYWVSALPITIDPAGMTPKALRALVRKHIVNMKFETMGRRILMALDLMDLPAADARANAITKAVLHETNETIKTHYPFPHALRRSTTITASVSDGTEKDEPYAVWTRSEGAHFRIARRALKDGWLPCPRVFDDHRKAVILDAAEMAPGLIYVQWAGMRDKNSLQLHLYKGALCEDELVAGYDTEEEVLQHEEAIRAQARVVHITRALTQ